MKLLKVVSILLISAMVALFACGCAESFTYTYVVDELGAVHFEYLLVYDTESEDAEIVKQQALAAMSNYVVSKGLNEYATLTDEVEGEVRLEVVYPSFTDYYIANGRTGKEPNEIDDPDKVGFIDRYDTYFSSYLSEDKIEEVRDCISEEYRDFPLEYCDFYFTYGTPSKLENSNGEVTEEDGIYYHTWKFNYGEEPEMVVSSYHPNGTILFSVIILVFILSLTVIFVIINNNSKKERKLRAAELAGGDVAERDDAPRE